jgi:hypothetical protein
LLFKYDDLNTRLSGFDMRLMMIDPADARPDGRPGGGEIDKLIGRRRID